MKFKLLSIGQKFEYQNEVYLKTSPIIAKNIETGHNKMIPAYAHLNLLDKSAAEKEIQIKEKISSKQVLDAFDEFYSKCVNLIEDKTALDIARDKFMQNIS